MQTIATKPSGGRKAAKPENINHQPQPWDVTPEDSEHESPNGHPKFDDIGPRPRFDEDEHNEIDDTEDSTTYCHNWDDVVRRESYDYISCWDDPANYSVRSYRFGLYGDLRVVIINSEAWCALDDSGRIAGDSVHNFTGGLNDGFAHVRGWPGYLEPDGVRQLDPYGISGTGIRLEALRRVFGAARGSSFLSECLEVVINDVYSGVTADGKFPEGSSTRIVRPNQPGAQPNNFRQHRYYDTNHGEFRAVIIGTHVWVNVVDVSRYTLFQAEVITQFAGQSRIVTIANADLTNADAPDGSEVYVLADAVYKLLRAMEHGDYTAECLERWVSQELLSVENQLKMDLYVYATTLHLMLGKHLDFEMWVGETAWKNSHPLPHFTGSSHLDTGDDFKIVLTEARDIALREGGQIGKLVSILLRDGGFFHNGPLAESADETLKRFQGLVPDRSGQVDARAVHEFIQNSGPFDDWVQALEDGCAPHKPCSTLYQDRISLQEADRRGLWRNRLNYYVQCSSKAAVSF